MKYGMQARRGRFAAGGRIMAAALSFALLCPGAAMAAVPGEIPSIETPTDQLSRLKDNKLEWDELGLLVRNYNPTISAMWDSYRKNDRNDVYDIDYNDALNNIENTYSDALGKSDVGDAAAEAAYRQSVANVDNTAATTDRDAAVLTDLISEANVTEQLRKQLIGIYTNTLNTQKSRRTAAYSQTLLDAADRKLAIGQATALDVLNARKAVQDADVTALADEAAAVKARQTVLVNLGWTYDAAAEICEIPIPTDAELAAVSLESSINEALTNSLPLKLAERKLAIAQGDIARSTDQLQADNTRQQVKSDMTARYQNLLQAENTVKQQQLASSNAAAALARVTRTYAVGTSSLRDLEKAQYNADTAAIDASLSSYALAEAYYTYLAGLNGLAGNSAG